MQKTSVSSGDDPLFLGLQIQYCLICNTPDFEGVATLTEPRGHALALAI